MKPWNTLSDRERDALIAEKVCGWSRSWQDDGETFLGIAMWIPPSKNEDEQTAVLPAYTTDRNAFAAVEEALERRGLVGRYEEMLIEAVEEQGRPDIGPKNTATLFPVLTAPLDIRCKAALRACGVEVG